MKNSIKILAALAVIGFSGNAMAQNSATATGTANATIIKPISFHVPATATGQYLLFGNIIGSSTGGTVTEAGGTNTFSNANLNPGVNTGVVKDANFEVDGQPNANIDIWHNAVAAGLPAGFTLVLNGAGPEAVGTTQADDPAGSLDATLDGTGKYTFAVGGTLTVPANAGSGVISTTWTQVACYE